MISDLYRDKLQQIINDDLLLKAIRYVFEEVIEEAIPEISDDDGQLGQRYRAYMTAKGMMEKSFQNILSYRIPPKQSINFNKAN